MVRFAVHGESGRTAGTTAGTSRPRRKGKEADAHFRTRSSPVPGAAGQATSVPAVSTTATPSSDDSSASDSPPRPVKVSGRNCSRESGSNGTVPFNQPTDDECLSGFSGM